MPAMTGPNLARSSSVVLNRTDARRSTIYSYGTSAYSKYTQYYQS